MSYQVLARKWRPRGFESLVGQDHVVRALRHGLEEGRLHHAYLFTGTRGVGKTTIARILAKSFNCETGVTATPCGVCGACTEIDSGRFVDLLEVDAATNTKVDEMRQLLENAVYAPTRGRYKVYVIDEVHMLSNSAFNAMLKTLEEPPEHVKFILATTDPQKIPVTVLSRCLQFNLKQMSQVAIVDHLERILQEEKVVSDVAALRLVARSANGSMRDALSLLDQAIAYGAGEVKVEEVSTMLGAIGFDHVFSVIDALMAGDASQLLGVADAFVERSLSFDAALQTLGELWVRIQVAQMAAGAMDAADPDASRLRLLAERLDPEYVQLAYQITLQGRQQLPYAPDPASGFVMTLLRLHAFFPSSSGQPAIVQSAEKKTDGFGRGTSFASELTCPPPHQSMRPTVSAVEVSSPQSMRVGDLQNVQIPIERSSMPETVSIDVGCGDWSVLLERMNLSGMVRELAQHCVMRKMEGRCVELLLSPTHRHLLSRSSQDRLQQALVGLLGSGAQVKVDIEDAQVETPAALANRQRRQAQDLAVAAIESDPVVRDVIELMDASLIESSIRPVTSGVSLSKGASL